MVAGERQGGEIGERKRERAENFSGGAGCRGAEKERLMEVEGKGQVVLLRQIRKRE